MRKARLLLIAAAVACTLMTACASQKAARFSPADSCVYVDKDGSVSSALVQKYEGEAVDEKDLKQYLEAAVIRYNKENGGQELAENQAGTTAKLPAAIQNVSVKDNTMKVVFDYASVEHLVKFRDTNDNADVSNTVSVVEVSQASASGGDISKEEFMKPDGSKPSEEELKGLDGAVIAKIEGGGKVMFAGKVLFITEGAQKVDDYTVSLPEGKTSRVVFK